MSDKTSGVVEKLDVLLSDDKNFTTRAGLRFMTTVMRDALVAIGDITDKNENIDNRLAEIDKAFLAFMKQQTKKEEQASEERKKWRWVIITPTIAILIAEIARLIFR